MRHLLQDSGSAASADKVFLRSGSEGELFKKILGARWLELHPDIRRRFECNPAPGEPLRYQGVLSELRCSRVGKLLGHLTQPLIKGADSPYGRRRSRRYTSLCKAERSGDLQAAHLPAERPQEHPVHFLHAGKQQRPSAGIRR